MKDAAYIEQDSLVVFISADTTRYWARGQAYAKTSVWLCSTLAGNSIAAWFDSNGLTDLRINGEHADPESGLYPGDLWIDGNELNAIIADSLKYNHKFTENHPAWFVVVGQFQ